jgi:hypothetical protein
MNEDLTWICHICGRERPDDKISVYSSRVETINGKPIEAEVTQNVRYCNDNPDCIEKSTTYSFFT